MKLDSKIYSSYTPKTIAVKLNNAAQKSVKQKHPWIFQDSIDKLPKNPQTGDLAIIFDNHTNKFIGAGLFDMDSPIRIKVLHSGPPTKIDAHFFKEKIEKAHRARSPLLNTKTNAYRLIYGENDGFPGLICDVYVDHLVMKIYSNIWFPYLPDLMTILIELFAFKVIVLRMSRNVSKTYQGELKDGETIYGKLKNPEIHFVEHGIKFSANIIKGHKTGYFLDHRHNRLMVGQFSKNKKVLDVFSYAGGFSVHALNGGATEVLSLDISKHALLLAKSNGKLNKHKGKHHTLCGDAFDELKRMVNQKEKFDIVVIDPPSFAKKADETKKAINSYFRLAQLGVQLVSKKGILVLASCSSRVSESTFFLTVEQAMSGLDYDHKLIRKTYHDIDHPVNFPEAAYLKCGYYQIN